MDFPTRIVHAGVDRDPATGASSVPLYQASTYSQEDPENPGRYDYVRSGNPTRAALEKALAELEGGAAALAFASGMAAVSSTLLLFRPGDHIIVGMDVYGGTFRVLDRLFARWGLKSSFVDTADPANIQAAVASDSKAILIETPSNPFLSITDLSAAAAVARRHNLLAIADGTFTTPFLQRPLECGFDLVIHSATKFLNGHSDVLAGAVIARTPELGEELRFIQNAFGAVLGVHDSWLLLRGLKTLGVRLAAEQETASWLAGRLADLPGVVKVHYPSLPGHPGREIHLRQAAGGGAVLSLIAGYLFWRRRRAIAEAEQELNSTLTSESSTDVMEDSSVFHNTAGGQSVNTSSLGQVQTDFSQVGPGSIDTDEVDPVAEADVYMAYGRDAQAEEILLEARQKDPKRTAIAVKLLEVYSGRKDVKQFEALATGLYGETGGVGADWEKAAAMGRVLDPNNPIFRVTASGGAVSGTVKTGPADSAPTISVATAVPAKASPQLVGTFELERGNASPGQTPSVGQVNTHLPEKPKPAPAAPAVPVVPAPKEEAQDLDFDIGTKIVAPPVAELDEAEAKAQQSGIDFDLGGATLIPRDFDKEEDSSTGDSYVETDVQGGDKPVLEDDAVEFDVSLTESTFLGRHPPEPPSSFNMASIDLDLHSPELEIADVETPAPAAEPAKAPAQQEARQDAHVSTAVNPNLSTAHMETVITPQAELVPGSQSDTAWNPDFATEQMETQVVPNVPDAQTETAFNFELANQQAETVVSGPVTDAAEQELAPELDIGASEEVTTKLDLAKAYEEMGDVEGARELLQEVLKEGNPSQREAARSTLDKLGG